MLSSRENTDPRPYFVAEMQDEDHDGRCTQAEVTASANDPRYEGVGGTLYNLARFLPRPEFQCAHPNPILVSFRDQAMWDQTTEDGKREELAEWLWWLSDETHVVNRFQRRDHIEHARKVLARLAALLND